MGKIQEYLPKKEPLEHYLMVREYPEKQGKYFRPELVLLVAEMFGGKKEEARKKKNIFWNLWKNMEVLIAQKK
ncbi:polyprenyl synthetase family protein [Candidatus Parcubacteria bacterium]|nr:polyprenyl synthetase family protein [Patescibacteria group bacterium]MCG2693994.1 polyprenyl synthetase family protein [Candidatus Parcubacteria bacterium]